LSTPAAKVAAKNGLNRIIKTHYDLDLERFLDGVATGCRVPWSDAQSRELGDRVLMTWDQVISLRKAGMSVGSHSHAHRVLQTLPPAALGADLKLARALLEGHLGESVRTIAYPVGDSIAAEPRIRQAVVKSGYEMGFTTLAGINSLAPGEDALDLRRLMADRGLATGVARLWMAFPFLAARATRRPGVE
jgi:peptidoglycan/xylan/chitin deacetylase (PgdA/CDA1 family)